MNEKEILKTVCKLVSEHLEMPLKDVKKSVDVPFLEYRDQDGGLICDPLDFTELLLALEEEFGIEVPLEEEENLKTINDVVRFIPKANPLPDEEGVGDDEGMTPELQQQMKDEMYNIWVKTLGKDEADKLAASLFD